MIKSKIADSAGIILIRLMAPVMILMVGVIGLAPLMVVKIDSNSLADELTEATDLAQNRIEELRYNRSYSKLPYFKYETKVREKYYITSKVDDGDSDPTLPDSLYRICVNVGWTDHKNLSRSVNYKIFKVKE